MKRTNSFSMTLSILMSSLLVIMQSCVVYNNVPINLDQAVEASTTSINYSKSKIYYKDGNTQKCFKVIKDQNDYYCEKRKEKMFKVDYSKEAIAKEQVDFVKTQDKATSIVAGATLGSVGAAASIYLLAELFISAIVF